MEITKPVVTAPTKLRKLALLPKARQWRKEGYSFKEIATACGVCEATVWHWTKDVPKGDIFKGG